MASPLASTQKLSRRERERLLRRREILDAAQAVFAEKGYTNATLDEIAQRAEFGKGTLYNYFEGGKEDILFAVFDEIYEEMCRVIEDSFTLEKTEGQPFREAFRGFVIAYMDYFVERQELFMILVKEAYRMVFSEDRDKAAYFQRQRERMVKALVPTLSAAQQRGELKPLPPVAVAHMILGNLNGMQMHICLEEAGDNVLASSEASADFVTTMLCDGLLAQPAPYHP